MNNCLCNLFDNNCTWIIIIALIIKTDKKRASYYNYYTKQTKN